MLNSQWELHNDSGYSLQVHYYSYDSNDYYNEGPFFNLEYSYSGYSHSIDYANI